MAKLFKEMVQTYSSGGNISFGPFCHFPQPLEKLDALLKTVIIINMIIPRTEFEVNPEQQTRCFSLAWSIFTDTSIRLIAVMESCEIKFLRLIN
jgi:hypothetical protein